MSSVNSTKNNVKPIDSQQKQSFAERHEKGIRRAKNISKAVGLGVAFVACFPCMAVIGCCVEAANEVD